MLLVALPLWLALGGTASAHGGPVAVTLVGRSVNGSTVTYTVRLTYVNDGHPVTGSGVTVSASGPGGTRSGALRAVGATGNYSGSITLAPGTWSVQFVNEEGSSSTTQVIGPATTTTTAPRTTTPPTTAVPATAAPRASVPPTTARSVTSTTERGTTTTTGRTSSTTTTAPGASTSTTVVGPGASVAGETTTTGVTTTDQADGLAAPATSPNDSGGSNGLVLAGGAVAAAGVVGAGAVWARRRGRTTSS